jgi:YVTN family beta-propeller protein
MKMNLSKIFLMSIFVTMVFAGTYSNLMDYAYSETPSYNVVNPDFEGKATSAIVNEKTNRVYITDFFGGKLVVLDGITNKILESMDVVRTPFGVGINSNTNTIYVGGEYANTLSIINATTSQVIKEITLQDPYDIAVNPNNNTVYVTSDRLGLVFVIDGAKNEIITSFEVLIPCGIAVNPITGRVYVTSESENLVHVWDGNTNQQITTIKVQESPRGVTVNPVTNMIYVTNQETNTISVIDGATNEIIDSVDVGEMPRRVVVDSQTNIIYVSNQESKNISVIDGVQNKVIKTIPVKEPFELAINSETGKLYSMYYGGDLSIITRTINQISPLKQSSSGLDPHNVKCNEGLELVFKNSNFQPSCVKPSSIQKLIERGWATDHTPKHSMEIKN